MRQQCEGGLNYGPEVGKTYRLKKKGKDVEVLGYISMSGKRSLSSSSVRLVVVKEEGKLTEQNYKATSLR